MQIKMWIVMLLKKQIKNREFLVMLILLPVACAIFYNIRFKNHTEDEITVYLYARTEDIIAGKIIKNLCEEYDSEGYKFQVVQCEDVIYESVRNSDVECGYIFEENLSDRIKNGIMDGNIILVERMGSAHTDIINEMVFSTYFKEYVKEYTLAVLDGEKEQEDEFVEKYEQSLEEWTQKFIMKQIPTNGKENSESKDVVSKLLAIIIFLYAMLCMDQFQKDRAHGILIPVPNNKILLFRMIYFGISLFLVGGSAYIGMLFAKEHENLLWQGVHLLFYVTVLAILCTVVSSLVQSRQVILGMIPVVTIFHLVVSDVFFDLSYYLPIIKILRYLCIPQYYMDAL